MAYLNQCWNIVNWTLMNKLQWNSDRNSNIFIQENTFENVICEMASIISQCVNTVLCFVVVYSLVPGQTCYCNCASDEATLKNRSLEYTRNIWYNRNMQKTTKLCAYYTRCAESTGPATQWMGLLKRMTTTFQTVNCCLLDSFEES